MALVFYASSMAMLPPFRDEETVLSGVPLARAVAVVVVLGGTSVLALALALSPLARGADVRLTLVALALVVLFTAVRIAGTRLRLQGNRFEVHRPWGERTGSADEFLGWKAGLFTEHAYLLRREDLKWVELPALSWNEPLNSNRYRWLWTYLPVIEDKGLRAVRSRSELPRATARMLIDRPLPALPPEDFYGSTADIDLARAARAIGKFGYTDARQSLEQLLPRLPQPSAATAFVFDALRSVGNAATAAALEAVLERFARQRTHFMRAFAELATPAQRPTLERMLHDEDRFVARQARAALQRLERGGA